MKNILLLLTSIIFAFPAWSYAHEEPGEQSVSCSVNYYVSLAEDNRINVTVSPSLRFIKSHFEIPEKIRYYDIPVVARFKNGRVYSGNISVHSSEGFLSLAEDRYNAVVPDKDFEKKDYAAECYIVF